MKRDEQLSIAVQALRDIIDPIGKFRREVKPGHELNGGMAVMLANDRAFVVTLAKDALRKMGRRV